MSTASAPERFLTWSRLAGHSPSTINRRRKTLRYAAEQHGIPADQLTPGAIDRDVIEAWLVELDSVETRRAYLNDLRAYTRWGLDREEIFRDPLRGVPVPKPPKRLATPLDEAQVAAVRSACLDDQDRLLVELGLRAGLRVSEMATITGDHVMTDRLGRRVLVVRQGKGRKDRAVQIDATLVALLARVSPAQHSGGAVSNRIRRVLRRAGIADRRPHDLRATFATELLRITRDIHFAKECLGHSSTATTERYIGLLPRDMPPLYGVVDPAA